MKKLFNKLFTIVLFASIFSFASCEIGLGESVDIIGPTVNITDPAPRENVMEIFDISGTVWDDFEVASLTVICGGNEWKNVGGTWSVKIDGASDFVEDKDSEWNVQSDGKTIIWTVKNVDFRTKNDGDYEIVVSAIDTSGNTSGDSKKSRTIVVDKEAPVITVSSPLTKKDSAYFTNINDYKDITIVSNFVTGDFTISGSTTDENAIKYIDIFIQSTDNETTYFEVRLAQDINNIPASYTTEKYKIVDSLRAWETDVKLASCALKDLDSNKHVLKIVTKTVDSSGNEGTKTHGYFCLWKTADYPWIEVNLGTEASPLSVYAGSKLLGNAYDDTAVKEVYVTIKEDSSSGNVVGDYNRKSIYTGNEENIVFFNFEVPQICKNYYVKFETVDINGKAAESKDGYIKVEDKTFPFIEINHKVGGVEKTNGETLFGDENGCFTFVINATDDTKVKSVKIAYMTNDEAIVSYSDKSASEWNIIGTSTEELKNGKVLSVNLTADGIDPITQKKKYKGELPVNIFTDLGIDGSTNHRLSNQTFVFRVEDENSNAITKDYTILGDIEAPLIQFTKIDYNGNSYTQNAAGKTECNGEVCNNGIPAFTSSSSITVYGKISDDSITAWGLNKVNEKWNVGNGKLYKLECNGTEISPIINIQNPVTENGKKWYTFSAIVENTSSGTNLKGSSLVYKAVLKDFNNNEVTQTYAFLVDTQTLKVEYIYTSKADGCYGVKEGTEDTVIPIKIRFNKSLKFTAGAAGMPYIKLNNNTNVTMASVSASGDREFVFNYTVKNGGTDIDKLNVTEFELNNGTISDSNGNVTTNAVSLITNALGANSGINLADKKNITIIKTLPVISNITVTPDNDYTKTTIVITYSKAVKKGNGDITVTQQNVKKVPPVLSENEYKVLVSKEANIADYYEYTTNGADSSFKSDLTPKYVLKFDYNADNTTLVNLYKSTNNYILTQNVKSNKVSINSEGTVVTIILGKLPCIGADYKIAIPEGFVVDKAGGSSFPVAALAQNDSKASYPFSTTALPLEKPVIRIKKDDTTVTAVSGGFEATQPMTASVKIDCETSGAVITYFYESTSYGQSVFTCDNDGRGTRPSKPSATPVRTPTGTESNTYSAAFPIGDANSRNGLEYKITATATKDGKNTNGYEVAQRTTIQINNRKVNNNGQEDENGEAKLKLRVNDLIQDKDFGDDKKWLGATITESKTNSKKLGLFLRGGDNPTGGNTTPGLPTTWSPKDLDKAILFTEDNNDFYIVSWKITKDLYFMPLAGLMDGDTIKDEKYQGPKYTCNAQNRWIKTYTTYPAEPGSYLVVANTQNYTVTFEVGDAGKARMVRK